MKRIICKIFGHDYWVDVRKWDEPNRWHCHRCGEEMGA